MCIPRECSLVTTTLRSEDAGSISGRGCTIDSTQFGVNSTGAAIHRSHRRVPCQRTSRLPKPGGRPELDLHRTLDNLCSQRAFGQASPRLRRYHTAQDRAHHRIILESTRRSSFVRSDRTRMSTSVEMVRAWPMSVIVNPLPSSSMSSGRQSPENARRLSSHAQPHCS